MDVSKRYDSTPRTLLTTAEVITEFPELGISQQALRIWARTGKIPAVRLPSGRLRFRHEDIEALLRPSESGESQGDLGRAS